MPQLPLLPEPPEPPSVPGLPTGYVYRVTRYADAILRSAFPALFDDLVAALEGFTVDVGELQASGGNRTPFVDRFDRSLEERGWGKRRISIETRIDGEVVSEVRGHEIDMFRTDPGPQGPYPGVAVEMEWNNKDPFFDRDLTNFHALHRGGALAVGVIVTRGPVLQEAVKELVRNPQGGVKYGASSTHWDKLMPRVDLGGGGECPLVLVGIEAPRVRGLEELARDRGRDDLVPAARAPGRD